MEKLEALDRAYKEISRKKKLIGYKYGETDCFSLARLYDYYVTNRTTLRDVIPAYNTPRTCHNRLAQVGYPSVKELFVNNGYKEVEFKKAIEGDICVFHSAYGDFTVAIFDGKIWLNSSNAPKYERLPSKYVEPKVSFVVRWENTDEKIQ